MNILDKYENLIHFSFSMHLLAQSYINEICMRDTVSMHQFFLRQDIRKILNSSLERVYKGKILFAKIKSIRYPLTGGKVEFSSVKTDHIKEKKINSKEAIIKQFYYGENIVHLGEYVLSLIRTCPMDCSYCFLTEVYRDKKIKIMPDYSLIQKEVKQLVAKHGDSCLYINAGENADSLILDMEFNLVSKLWKIMFPYKNITLELRTKTNKINHIIKLDNHENRIVLSFSLNPEEHRQIFESNTATIQDRIIAMQTMSQKGWSIGIRLEPILYTFNYVVLYTRLIRDIFSHVPVHSIHSVSMGCLRLTKDLMRSFKHSHPSITLEEWILYPDKKYRYAESLRIDIYKNILNILTQYIPEDKIILSIEDRKTWDQSKIKIKTMPNIA